MKWLETAFEWCLWNSRFVVLLAVVSSMAACFAIFYMATVDVVYMVGHIIHYADPSMAPELRQKIHDETISHIVIVMDGYLLATVMLIFSLGLYELFISDIDQARSSKASSKILLIENLDDLKARLAKVILMILVVTLFENALKVKIAASIDLLYFGGAVALIGLALYLTHASEDQKGKGGGSSSHKD